MLPSYLYEAVTAHLTMSEVGLLKSLGLPTHLELVMTPALLRYCLSLSPPLSVTSLALALAAKAPLVVLQTKTAHDLLTQLSASRMGEAAVRGYQPQPVLEYLHATYTIFGESHAIPSIIAAMDVLNEPALCYLYQCCGEKMRPYFDLLALDLYKTPRRVYSKQP